MKIKTTTIAFVAACTVACRRLMGINTRSRKLASLLVVLTGSSCAMGAAPPQSPSTTIVPLCPGLTIVTAISQPQGDYESIKTIESVTPQAVPLRYSSYMQDPRGDYDAHFDYGGPKYVPPPWVPFTVFRRILSADLESANAYLQQFGIPNAIPETVKGTTALGISRKVYRELKAEKKPALTVFQPILPGRPMQDGQAIASILRKHPNWHLAVEGHTDKIGSASYSLDLSKQRSAAVKDALVKKYAIDPARLPTNGYGASRPKDTNDTVEGRARNRRVELVKVG